MIEIKPGMAVMVGRTNPALMLRSNAMTQRIKDATCTNAK